MKKQEKSKTISLRISESDYAKICNNAKEVNINVSDYIRKSSLKSTVIVNPHSEILAINLCEITNLINEIIYEGFRTPELNETFKELKKEVLNLWQYLK